VAGSTQAGEGKKVTLPSYENRRELQPKHSTYMYVDGFTDLYITTHINQFRSSLVLSLPFILLFAQQILIKTLNKDLF
jgi:hypothetical protein